MILTFLIPCSDRNFFKKYKYFLFRLLEHIKLVIKWSWDHFPVGSLWCRPIKKTSQRHIDSFPPSADLYPFLFLPTLILYKKIFYNERYRIFVLFLDLLFTVLKNVLLTNHISEIKLFGLSISMDLCSMTTGPTHSFCLKRKSSIFWILSCLAFIHLRVMQIG